MIRLYWTMATVVAAILAFANFAIAHSSAPSATIDAGVVVGLTTSVPSSPVAVNQFLGVPFAAPPKRFARAHKPQPWSRPLETKQKGPSCIQQFFYPQAYRDLAIKIFNTPPPEESEDCLSLNVYAPATPATGNGRAVLFWIYGGGLTLGYASHPMYDGSQFAAHEDVIVVAANYRMNTFGFPNAPELPLQDRNLGFLDQRKALDWVQRNIHAFGGDPSKVTLFGESAGAWSIDALLTSYPNASKPPFRAAILESGQLSYRGKPAPGKPFPDGRPAWDALAAALNCTSQQSNMTCIMAASATTIKDIIEKEGLYFTPTFDNKTYLSDMGRARTSKHIARIPILSGTNANEGRALVVGQNNVTAYLQSLLGPDASPDVIAAITAAYPVGGTEFPTAYDAISAMDTDDSFHCGAALLANDTAAAGIPSWRYYFNATFPNNQLVPDGRAYHSSEVKIVFSTYPRDNATTAEECALSDYMRSTWARFAKDPEAGPGWSAIGEAALDVAVLQNGKEAVKLVEQSTLDGRCAVWRDVLVGM